jgi:predicted protein tyrosine phosphatase
MTLKEKGVDGAVFPIRQRRAVAAYPREAIAQRCIYADALISIGGDMEEPIEQDIIDGCFGGRALRLCFSDIPVASWKGFTGPVEEDIRRAIDYADRIRVECGEHSTIAVHCAQGVSRSTSIALAIIADHLGPGQEGEAVGQLLDSRTDPALPAILTGIQVAPNPGIVEMTDRILGRHNALHWALMDAAPRYVTWVAYWQRKLAPANPE